MAENLTLHDAAWFAEQIGMSTYWVTAHYDLIPHHKFGRARRFSEDNLREFLELTKQDSVLVSRGRTLRSIGYHDRRRRSA